MIESSGSRAGEQIGNYRLIRLLGRGGFAEVYLGQHIFLNTQAAIKILSTRLSQPEQENFLNEARTIARLTHPHIVRVLDFGMHENSLPYLVMDYAPHGSLRERHPKGEHLPLPTVLSYVNQAASALQYAHDEKVIHRDVKPENMLLGRNGEILLGDFGISVVTQTTQSQSLQEALGTVAYMAPEQIQGKPRPASDQYSLGVVTYEWLCGERPFQGGLTELSVQHIFKAPPPLREKIANLPADVERVVMTALAKDPHQRFGGILAFAQALEHASHSASQPLRVAHPDSVTQPSSTSTTVAEPPSPYSLPTVPNTPPLDHTLPDSPSISAQILTPAPAQSASLPSFVQPRLSRRVVVGGLLGLAGLAAIGGGASWYTYMHRFSPQGTLIYTFPFHSDTVNTVAWHGERIASGSADKTVKIWGATSGANALIYSQHTDAVNQIAWSPDGARIASAGNDQLALVWDASNGKTLLTYKGHQSNSPGIGGIYGLAWSPDSTRLASCGSDGTVQIWDASSGKLILTYKGHFGDNNTAYNLYGLAWSPDGVHIASGGQDSIVKVWEVASGKTLLSYEKHSGQIEALTWSPDSKSIASASADKTVQVWAAGSNSQINTIYSGHTDAVYKIAWSPDGSRIASVSADMTVQIWSPTNAIQPYIYKRHSKAVYAIAWSDDSHRVASGSEDTTVQVWEAV